MKRIFTIMLVLLLVFTSSVYADSDHISEKFENYVYVYAVDLDTETYVGRVLVKGLKNAHNNPTGEELELVKSYLDQIEYVGEEIEINLDKLTLLEHDPHGVEHGNTWRLNSDIHVDEPVLEPVPVYVYAKKSEFINGKLNSSGWYTIGKVMVSGLAEPHLDTTPEELELVLNSLTEIEYISTAPVTVDKLGNWVLKLVDKGANDYVKTGDTWHLNGEYIHNHNFITTEPTCTEPGTAICDCGESYEIEALGHDMGEWLTIKEPTYEEAGLRERYCSRSDLTEQEEIPMLIKEEPGTPTEPEKPPIEPEQPEIPTEPEQPVEPENPSEPEQPTESAQPEMPTEPETPEEPEKPTQPEEPTAPEIPESPYRGEPGTPYTGDESKIFMWLGIALVSLYCMIRLYLDLKLED